MELRYVERIMPVARWRRRTRHTEQCLKSSGGNQNQTHIARTDFCRVIYSLAVKNTSECPAFQLQSTQAEKLF
jgi:hypothetical protein